MADTLPDIIEAIDYARAAGYKLLQQHRGLPQLAFNRLPQMPLQKARRPKPQIRHTVRKRYLNTRRALPVVGVKLAFLHGALNTNNEWLNLGVAFCEPDTESPGYFNR